MPSIPEEIQEECFYWQRKLRWPELVPKYIEIPDATGEVLFHLYQSMTVSLCEQATEFYTRLAEAAISRWHRNHSKKTARTAARNIIWARICRCRYFSLTGAENPTESDMPFSFT